MGKTKTKIIDASVEEVKEQTAKTRESKGKKEYEISIPGLDKTPVEPEKKKTTKQITKTTAKEKKTSQKHRSQKYLKATEGLDKSKFYPLDEAVETAKKASYSKFTGSLDIHINTRQTGIRGLVTLPYVAGKKLTILAFGPSTSSGQGLGDNVMLGDDKKLEEITKGKIDFDIIITTAEWMPKLAKVARVLGPKGLMPNPKNGTITTDLKKAVEGFQSGKTEYKSEPKAQVIHLSLGKLSQPNSELSENIKILLGTIGKSRIKKVTLAPTMGPSVKLDINSI